LSSYVFTAAAFLSGSRVDSFNWQSRLPLHNAAAKGRVECVKRLLKGGASAACFDVKVSDASFVIATYFLLTLRLSSI
jgi:hypothetical protein